MTEVKKNISEKVKCECGSIVAQSYFKRHIKTSKHERLLQQDPTELVVKKIRYRGQRGKARGKKAKTPEEQKLDRKLRSRVYYANPEIKQRHRKLMRERRRKNKTNLNYQAKLKRHLATLEKRLKKIWLDKGLIN